MENMRKTPNRLSVELDEEIHKNIKVYAAMRNITIRKWVYRAIINALAEEEKYGSMAAMHDLKERGINEESKGDV